MGASTGSIAFGAGTLIRSPVNGTGPSYGGTVLGTMLGLEVEIRRVMGRIPAEEFGGALSKLVHLRWEVTLTAKDITWDQDAVAASLPGFVTTNSPDLVPTVSLSGGSGYAVTGYPLLYVPHRVAAEAGFYVPDAIGVPEDISLAWSAYRAREHQLRFEVLEDSAGVAWTSGLISRIWTP